MRSHRLFAAAFCVPIAFCAVSCVQSHNDSPPTHADDDAEATGEAAEPWTRDDCYTAWKHNMKLCNTSPPNLRPECWAAASALLAVCLAAAQ